MATGSAKADRAQTRAIARLLHTMHTDSDLYYAIADKLPDEDVVQLSKMYHHLRAVAQNTNMMRRKNDDRDD